MSTSSFLIHILLVVSWLCFAEVGDKRAMGKQKRKMSVEFPTVISVECFFLV